MRRALIALLALRAFAGQVSLYPSQPAGTVLTAAQVDSAGNIYLAGWTPPINIQNGGLLYHSFVAKLAPDGSQIYKTVLAGSKNDQAGSIALAADGSLYVTGFTGSGDFPVTLGALQPALGSTKGQAFIAKISPEGRVQSATYFGGGAATSGSALAIAKTGEIYLTGTSSGSGFPATSAKSGSGNGFFLAKFNASLSTLLMATLAYGGTVMTLDTQGNVYAAGATTAAPGQSAPLQTSPGAFQNNPQVRYCSGGSIVFSGIGCNYQFVEKIDPAATNLIYATFLAGSFGASPAGIAVDANGNAIVAGLTNSADYPVTPGALQTVYTANAVAPPFMPGPTVSFTLPPATGFVTKLNTTGTGLIWSTFFGGSTQDFISGLGVDANGYIYITGQANSADLPGLSPWAPAGCAPSVNEGLGFVTRLSPDGTSLSPTQLIYGLPSCTYASCRLYSALNFTPTAAFAISADGTSIAVAGNGTLAKVDLFGSSRLACLTDPADNVQITSVAPGQVLSIFGIRLGDAATAVPPEGSASSLQGTTVTLNGVVAPILYGSANQINIQVPFEIAGQETVEMKVVNLGYSLREQKTLSVIQRQPSVFLATDALLSAVPGIFYCGNSGSGAQHALAINSDGTLNTCSNGASPGSTVTIFMNGLGPTQPLQGTGVITSGSPIVLSPGATGMSIISTVTSPGAISGVAQVRLRAATPGFLEVTPTVEGIMARNRVVVWVAER